MTETLGPYNLHQFAQSSDSVLSKRPIGHLPDDPVCAG